MNLMRTLLFRSNFLVGAERRQILLKGLLMITVFMLISNLWVCDELCSIIPLTFIGLMQMIAQNGDSPENSLMKHQRYVALLSYAMHLATTFHHQWQYKSFVVSPKKAI